MLDELCMTMYKFKSFIRPIISYLTIGHSSDILTHQASRPCSQMRFFPDHCNLHT